MESGINYEIYSWRETIKKIQYWKLQAPHSSSLKRYLLGPAGDNTGLLEPAGGDTDRLEQLMVIQVNLNSCGDTGPLGPVDGDIGPLGPTSDDTGLLEPAALDGDRGTLGQWW